jgi:hypothetical protein
MSRGGRTLAAVQVRIVRTPILPVGVAYVRWGPLFQRNDETPDSAIMAGMLESMRKEYCDRRGLILQIIPNAYPGNGPGDALANALVHCGFQADPTLPRYRTVVVDLSPPEDVMRKLLNQKWRNQLNGSAKNGLKLEVAQDMRAYGEFTCLYQEMRDRKGFNSAVDVSEFGRIQEDLPAGSKMTVFLASRDGLVVGALVCSLMGDTAIYLLGATNGLARELKASYFLHWQAMQWLKSRGARWYDLGGVDPESNPGGYHFKSGFGGGDMTKIAPSSAASGIWGGAVLRGMSWLCRARA